MARNVFGSAIGGIVGGIVLYLVGFLFWGTPLAAIAYSSTDLAANATVHQALAAQLTTSGTGTYLVPDPATDQGTVLYGQGPVATVHFNSGGFPVVDSTALIGGLVLAIIVGVIIAGALRGVATHVPTFRARARVGLLMTLAVTMWLELSEPILNHYGPGFFVYSFVAQFTAVAAAVLVIARWFLPAAAGASVGGEQVQEARGG